MKGFAAFLILLTIAFTGCKEKETSDSTVLEVADFAEMIGDPSEKIILDVRTPEEYYEGHIRYSKLINFHDEDFKDQVNQLDKQTPIYVYCASGVRSDKAATILRQEGFREVYVLKKGFNEWASADQEIVK